MKRPVLAVLAGVLLAHVAIARGAQDQDVDRIPEAALRPADRPEEAPGASEGGAKVFLEQVLTLAWYRRDLAVPPPPGHQPRWQERLGLDARRSWRVLPEVTLTYSGRLGVLAEEGGGFAWKDDLRHDLREGFASWNPQPRHYADFGRINLRSGVAAGFNPTDFFKTRAVVDRSSSDPAVLRENRLGTLMFRGQSIGERWTWSGAYAPSLYQPTAIDAPPSSSLDPMFDRTNARHRFLAKASADAFDGLSPELLFYREGGRTKLGANVVRSVGSNKTIYAEWAGGRRSSLIEEAFRYGQSTGSLPAEAQRVLPGSERTRFYHDLALGGSYSTETKLTLNLEYNYHEAGLSREDWRNWFDIGRAGAAVPGVLGQLWYIRAYALDQQEPLARHALFIRASRADAFVPDLELTGFLSVNLYDGSALVQIAAQYFRSNRWTFAMIGSADLGRERSEHGSAPRAYGVVLKAIRYF